MFEERITTKTVQFKILLRYCARVVEKNSLFFSKRDFQDALCGGSHLLFKGFFEIILWYPAVSSHARAFGTG